MTNLSDDILEGAEAIAKFLGGKWTPKRVYRVADKGGWPIWKGPQSGIMSRKSALLAYIEEQERKAIGSSQAANAA